MRKLMQLVEGLEFSVSATSRAPRGVEQHGKDYYFLSGEEFDQKIAEDAFVEWEEVYAGTKYGTLRSELERIWSKGNTILFDVDVKGGVRLKNIFGEQALSIFVMPPSIEELRRRLEGRATDSPEKIEQRLGKANEELGYAEQFDLTIVNDRLEVAVEQVCKAVTDFINK